MSDELRIPQADSRPRRKGHWAWAVPGVTILVAIIICWAAIGRHGPEIEIRFDEGHGLKPGDSLRYRGIVIGKVDRVLPTEALDAVLVQITLASEAAAVAREGSEFWIVRPQVSLTEVSGLDTVVGANYVTVTPGDGPDCHEFAGREMAPTQETLDPKGLRITVEALERGSLRAGGAVLYRQTQVGSILDVYLSADGNGVYGELYVRPEYRALVRGGSRFWDAGGVRMEAGITGLSLEMASMASLVSGGIAFATPPNAGPAAENGDEFAMFAKPEEEWISWQPSIMLGPDPDKAPPLVHATLRWKTEGIFKGEDERSGWLLPLSKNRLLGLPDLLIPEDGGGGTLRVDDADPKAITETQPLGGLALLMWQTESFWPGDAIRVPESPEDVIIVGDPKAAPRAVLASRFEPDSAGWKLPRAIAFSEAWHGAAVLGDDGKLIGMLSVERKNSRIIPISELP